MRFDEPSRPVIDTRTDRDAKLKAFIAEALASRERAAPITLVARATDSPVAQALVTQIAASGRSDIAVHVVLFDIDAVVEDHASASILDLRGAEFRVLHDARFISAHEQLALSPTRAWIGDCMRRDPTKRDAFEIYHAHDAASAGHAITSFARLWSTARPLTRTVARAPAPAVIAAGQPAAKGGVTTSRG